MVTIVCCLFADGYRAYYMEGDAKNHVVAKPDETIIFTGWKLLHVRYRRLKIPYCSWNKRLKKKAS